MIACVNQKAFASIKFIRLQKDFFVFKYKWLTLYLLMYVYPKEADSQIW